MKDLIAVDSVVVIAEDNDDLRDSIIDALKTHFGKVIGVPNGKKVIEIMKSTSVNVVVTDYMMPEMNGLELIQYINTHHPMIPVLMLTANGMAPEVTNALKNGVFDILDKPIRNDLLRNRIQNSLLMPELLKVVWAAMALERGTPKLEEFLKQPFRKQMEVIHAYSAFIRTRALAKRGESA